MRTLVALFFVLAHIFMIYSFDAHADQVVPLSAAVFAKKYFEPLVDTKLEKTKRYNAITVGIVTPYETLWLPFGSISEERGEPSSATLFELGSITKGFLGLAVAKDVNEGLILLDQPLQISTVLPIPHYNSQAITWRHLVTHTSGLPRVPTNQTPSDPYQPYLDYNLTRLTDFLRQFSLESAPGNHYAYSNLGAGLAGTILEEVHNESLEDVLIGQSLKSHRLSHTKIFLDEESQSNLAPVHLNGEIIPSWQWRRDSSLQGAGALKSTIDDMISFLKVMMGGDNSMFIPTVHRAISPLYTEGNLSIGLFWHRWNRENIVWHNGGTYGSSSFIGFDPDRRVGIVALSNSQFIDKSGVDPRLDMASLQALKDIVAQINPIIQRPLQVLLDYDKELQKQREQFAKIAEDLANKNWVVQKLQHMRDTDQMMRKLTSKMHDAGFSTEEKTYFSDALLNRFRLMDWENTEELKKLIKLFGWFRISEFGEQADRNAWLIVQHADHDPNFQKEILKTLESLYPQKETRPDHYAYLWDRVAASFYFSDQRKLQRFGTQGYCKGPGVWEPIPIENNGADVDTRRRELGLEPLADYIKRFIDICK